MTNTNNLPIKLNEVFPNVTKRQESVFNLLVFNSEYSQNYLVKWVSNFALKYGWSFEDGLRAIEIINEHGAKTNTLDELLEVFPLSDIPLTLESLRAHNRDYECFKGGKFSKSDLLSAKNFAFLYQSQQEVGEIQEAIEESGMEFGIGEVVYRIRDIQNRQNVSHYVALCMAVNNIPHSDSS